MRRPERAVPKTQECIVTEHEVRPKLRFLLSEEARAEGKRMARNLGCYTLRRSASDTASQFRCLISGIREGRFPNIAAADEIMGGVLTESLQRIADGFRQPEWMIWRQSWANAMSEGRPGMMEDLARRMMLRDPRYPVIFIDDESEMLPDTVIDISGSRMNWRCSSNPDGKIAAPQLDPEAVDAARVWYRDVFLRREFDNSSMDRYRAISAFTPEQKVAHEQHCAAAAKLKEYAYSVISEMEKLTKEKFERGWKTKDDLHAALRDHFKACGYDEELDFRWLRLGAYN